MKITIDPGFDVRAKRIEVKDTTCEDTSGEVAGNIIEIEIPIPFPGHSFGIKIEDFPQNPFTKEVYFKEMYLGVSDLVGCFSFILPDGREGSMRVGAAVNSVRVSFRAKPEAPFGNQPKGFLQRSTIPIPELPKKDKEKE